MIYIGTLSSIETIYMHTIKWQNDWWIMNWKWYRQKWSLPNLRYYLGICLNRGKQQNLSKNNHLPNWDSKGHLLIASQKCYQLHEIGQEDEYICGSRSLTFYFLFESVVLNVISSWQFIPFQVFNSSFNLNRTQMTCHELWTSSSCCI
jgi:hypothetical protein